MLTAVAMSGGADSSVAALELKREGHDIIGITIKTWPEQGELRWWREAVQCARRVAEELGIPHHVVDLSREFGEAVRDYFADEYARGRTPNPCIFCNSKIKFGRLLSKARELGAEKIATGHYARIVEVKGVCYLSEAEDKRYDQSYFLCDVSREALPFIGFPLGKSAGEMVRRIAASRNFVPVQRKSSQDICFAAADGGYRGYLSRLDRSAFLPGDMLDVSGKVIGRHNGIASYTIGQRRGLGIAAPGPVYVLKIDAENNTITVGEKSHAMNEKIRVSGVNWLIPVKPDSPGEFAARIRYNGEKAPAMVTPCGTDGAVVEFKEPQFAPTPGQAAVFYEGEIVAGGGWIEEVL